MSTDETSALVHEFWQRMASNQFELVEPLLSDEFVLEWPQSLERLRGAANFTRMNREYPANGVWQFTVHRVVGGLDEAVSDVSITDGVACARAITFFSMVDGRITRITEFWPEPYDAPQNRAHLVESMAASDQG